MAVKQKIPCPKCDGRGIIPQYFYNRKGICFLCWGAKYVMVKVPGGKSLEQVQKEMIAKEKPDFKKNPPKVDMPHKNEIKNPSYFPASNSKVDSLEAAAKGKDEDKGKGGAAVAEKTKFDFAAYKDLDAIQIQEKIQRDYKDSSVKELKELAEEMYKSQKSDDDEIYRVATAAAKGFENLIRNKEGLSAAELEKVREGIREKHKSETDLEYLERLRIRAEAKAEDEDLSLLARQRSKAEAEAFAELIETQKAVADAVKGQEAAVRAAMRDQAKDVDAANLLKLKDKLVNDAEKESGMKQEMLYVMADEVQKMYREKAKPKPVEGVPALPYNDDVFKGFSNPDRAREYSNWYSERMNERLGNPAALRELLDHYERYKPVKVRDFKYVMETALSTADMGQIDRALRDVGLSNWQKHNGTAEQYRELLKKLKSPEFAENKVLGPATIKTYEDYLYKAEGREMYAEFINKHLPGSDSDSNYIDYRDFTAEQLTDAVIAATEIERQDVKERAVKNLNAAIATRNQNSGIDAAREKAKTLNKEIDDKRKAIVSNISYNTDTEIGRKVAEMAAKGVNSPKDAIAIGELVEARMQANMDELGFDYADFAKKYGAYRDAAVELDKLEDEYKLMGKRRMDGRASFETRVAADDRYKELRDIVQKKMEEVQNLRRATYVYEAKMKKIKEEAYHKTMKEIREMGGKVAFDSPSTNSKKNKAVIDNIATVTDAFPKEWLEASSQTEISIAAVGRDGRAYSRGESKWQVSGMGNGNLTMDGGALGIDGNTSRSTLIHELQHRMEETNPNLKELMRQFYISKVSNAKGKAKKPKTIPGYSSREKYIEVADGGSKWINEYMGKFYGIGDSPENTRAWEIGTMSMEAIVLDKASNGKRLEFYQEDVHKFMLGVLASV